MRTKRKRLLIDTVIAAVLIAVVFWLPLVREGTSNDARGGHHPYTDTQGVLVDIAVNIQQLYSERDCPSDLETIAKDPEFQSRVGPVIIQNNELRKDFWGNPYTLRFTGREDGFRTFRVYSWGYNGIDDNGDGDDVCMEGFLSR